ncbi:long-chain fatty acid--CoA ligase [Nocardia sp. NPDC049707]|uniref:acyl-CoA synthetase n=1 Tax=Nocardia sp. NPDC049707 TaxID=3154735 RepID=UPI00343E4D59
MPDHGIGSWPRRRARICPGAVAFRQGSRTLTYAELADRVDRLARVLAYRGVRPGDRIAYLGLNDIAVFEVFFAVCRLGAIFVPLNTRLAPPEIGALLDDAKPFALFHGPEQHELIEQIAAQDHGVGLIVSIDDWIPDDSSPADVGYDVPTITTDIGLDDDAVILYTSGTTGRPKGAVLSHGNLTFNTMNQLAHVDVLSTDTALCMSPLFHATGLGLVTLPTLFKGGSVVVLSKFDPATILATFADAGVTSFAAVPTMLQMLYDHPDFEHTDLSSLRYVIYGGSAVAERVAVGWQRRGVDILHGYGMTEAAPGVCLAIPDGAVERPVSAGPPHFFTDITIRSTSTDMPPGTEGELLVRGLNVSRGYWNQSEDTPMKRDGDWFRSGDVVWMAQDGWIYIVDRIKDMIISGGENIYPSEVEARINAVPGVSECAVIGVPDERWGEVGLAYVVAAEPGAVMEQQIRDALRGALAAYKIPQYILFVDQLAKNATGKVVKQKLREMAPPS